MGLGWINGWMDGWLVGWMARWDGMGVWAPWLVQTHTSLSHDILPARSGPGLNAVNDQGQQLGYSPQPRPRNIATLSDPAPFTTPSIRPISILKRFHYVCSWAIDAAMSYVSRRWAKSVLWLRKGCPDKNTQRNWRSWKEKMKRKIQNFT